jgi:1-acyl-sn-glycerol-3-phosphate acyltransferase
VPRPPIERHRVNRKSADRAADLLAEGWSLLIYPEGGRTPDGWARPHRAGAAWLAERTGRAVVPVHVEGTRRILPRNGDRVRPGETHITFGAPLRPDPGEDARSLSLRIERAVATLADEQATDWWTATRRAATGRTPALTGPDAAAWRRTWSLGPEPTRPATGGHRAKRSWPGD